MTMNYLWKSFSFWTLGFGFGIPTIHSRKRLPLAAPPLRSIQVLGVAGVEQRCASYELLHLAFTP